MRPLLLLLALLTLGAAAPPERALEMSSGDWRLQCDNWRACRIIGIAAKERDARALVLIDRSAVPGSPWRVRMLFPDSEKLPTDLRLRAVNARNLPPPLRLEFDTISAPGIFDLPEQKLSHFLALLRAPGRAAVRASGLPVAVMPAGDIARLIGAAEKLQRRDPELPEPQDDYRRFDYDFFRVHAPPEPGLPPGMPRPCGRVSDRGSVLWTLNEFHRMWIVQCPGRSRIFVQYREGAVQPIGPDLLTGTLPAGVAVFDPEYAMLIVTARIDGRPDCGTRHSWGWAPSVGFVGIRTQKMPLCRGVDPELWPDSWSARRWRILG